MTRLDFSKKISMTSQDFYSRLVKIFPLINTVEVARRRSNSMIMTQIRSTPVIIGASGGVVPPQRDGVKIEGTEVLCRIYLPKIRWIRLQSCWAEGYILAAKLIFIVNRMYFCSILPSIFQFFLIFIF